MTPSRRTFLKSSAAIAAASLARPRNAFAGLAADSATAAPLTQFGYGDVALLDGPLRQQFDTNHAFYRALDEDSLLKPFRQRAGLPAPGDDMGGWYSWAPLADLDKPGNNGFAPGHSFGQVSLRPCARLRGDRRQSDPGKSASPGARLRARHHVTLLGRQPLSRLHLRQNLHRHDRCAPVCRGPASLQGARRGARFGNGASSPGPSIPRGAICPSAH